MPDVMFTYIILVFLLAGIVVGNFYLSKYLIDKSKLLIFLVPTIFLALIIFIFVNINQLEAQEGFDGLELIIYLIIGFLAFVVSLITSFIVLFKYRNK